jgi:hypothetical protein
LLAFHKKRRYSRFGGTGDAVFRQAYILCANPHHNRGINPKRLENMVDATLRNTAYAVFRWVLYKFVPDVHRQERVSREKNRASALFEMLES